MLGAPFGALRACGHQGVESAMVLPIFAPVISVPVPNGGQARARRSTVQSGWPA
jgi:hypothetical protein